MKGPEFLDKPLKQGPQAQEHHGVDCGSEFEMGVLALLSILSSSLTNMCPGFLTGQKDVGSLAIYTSKDFMK